MSIRNKLEKQGLKVVSFLIDNPLMLPLMFPFRETTSKITANLGNGKDCYTGYS